MNKVLKARNVFDLIDFYLDGPRIYVAPECRYKIPGFSEPLYMVVSKFDTTVTEISPIPKYRMVTEGYSRPTAVLTTPTRRIAVQHRNRPEFNNEKTRRTYEAWFALAMMNGLFEEVPK